MPFIGNQPAEAFSSFQKQDFTTSATTSYTLDHPVANGNEIALFINFVRQEPTAAYTASGTSLTLTSATTSSDDMYCVYLGKAVQTVNPPNGSVGTSQLADDAVTKAKTSDLMYPAFEAIIGSVTNLTDNAITKVAFDTEQFDTDSCYDATTNYRFTPTIAGKYFIYATVNGGSDTNNDIYDLRCYLYKNGSSVTLNDNSPNLNFRRMGLNVYASLDMNGSTDYVEIYFQSNISSGQARYEGGGRFGAYRIGD